MKSYFKTVWRMFGKHIVRLVSLVAIILISVGFISGIGSSSDMVNAAITEYYKTQNVSDFIVKSTTGFTAEQIQKAEELYGKANVGVGTSFDIQTGEKRSLRLYFLDLENWNINKPELTEGDRIDGSDKTLAYAETSDNIIRGYSAGERAEFDLGKELGLPFPFKISVRISGIIKSPLTFGKDGEPSYNNPEDTEIPDNIAEINNLDILENILYCSKDLLPAFMPYYDMYITAENRELFNAFSKKYERYIDGQKAVLADAFGDDARIITLSDNYSFKSVCASADKIRGIGYVLIVLFLAVTVLVVLSSMIRLMDEERSQIGCMKTLGFSSFAVVMRYLIFIAVPLLIGGTGAYFVGYGLLNIMRAIFDYSYDMPDVSLSFTPTYFIIASGIIALSTVLATLILGLRKTNAAPAELLRPKPPKNGGRTFLENVTFIWKRLSFKHKSSLRNVFRYKSRFFMTLVAVAVSAGLVFAALALLDICLFSDFGSAAIMGIAVVVVVFAGLLTAIVINVLTTINISERNREIATLMVLGYTDNEVCGYMYREIYINTFFGILLGYPVGMGIATLIFKAMGFGTVSGVSWFMWLLVPVVVFLFSFLVTLMLRPKIVKTKMNESLKAIE